MSFSTPIPPRIADAIVDELSDDSLALKQCSLISRQFRERSQINLYSRSKIDLYLPGGADNQRSLQEYLSMLPSKFIYHIGRLSLFVEEREIQGGFTLQEERDLIVLFNGLKSLRAFSLLMDNSTGKFGPYWLSRSLESAVVSMIRVTQVSEVTVHNLVDFPMVLLSLGCPHLRMLDFHGRRQDAHLIIERPVIPERAPVDKKGCLHVLKVDDTSVAHIYILLKTSKLPQSMLTLSNLRDFAISGNAPHTMDLVVRIVSEAASLGRLTWDCEHYWYRPELMAPAFPKDPTSLRLAFVHHHNRVPPHLNWILMGLQNAPECSRLEELVLLLDVGSVWNNSKKTNFELWNECDAWARTIDSLLMGRRFSGLRRMAIFVRYAPINDRAPSVAYLDVMVKRLKQKLPMLHSKGVLSVQWLVNTRRWPLRVALREMEQGHEGDILVDVPGALESDFQRFCLKD
ncbi:hypothetical protein Hypma_005161 [Hypsizygus marmoreus]|uniref:F-box domain-containing protein n=1 Tax=Hypsizygus marmoreus TaxID=39966 RepID=A0A369K5E0_HYPMA|nr:hypothetical protein Hypma_005161 [Hypsizygus marmoreus]